MRFFTLVLLSLSLSYVYGAETTAKPLPPDIQKIVTEYNDSVLTAKSKAVDDLRKVMETYTKKGDLDNAVLIRNTIEAMTPKNTEKTDLFGNKAGGDISKAIVGKWEIKYDNGHTKIISVDNSMNLSVIKSSFPSNSKCVLIYNSIMNKYIANNTDSKCNEIYEVIDGKIKLERFDELRIVNNIVKSTVIMTGMGAIIK